jgi:membrane associated rhomboid family serine protease
MSSYQNKASYWIYGDRIPVTKLLILANVVAFISVALFKIGLIPNLLGFSTAAFQAQPWTVWTLFTYPLTGIESPISLLFAGYWLWWAGGSLERSWGSRTFGLYFFGMSAVSALGLFLGFFLTGINVSLTGLWLPLAGVTVAYAMLNPEQQILFMFVIPLKLKYLAAIDAVLVLVSFGQMHLLLGVLGLSGCALSYWYVRRGRNMSFAPSPRRSADDFEIIRMRPRHTEKRELNPFKWYAKYKERKRLKDLFNRSGFDD